jgi:hypothetical protein
VVFCECLGGGFGLDLSAKRLDSGDRESHVPEIRFR